MIQSYQPVIYAGIFCALVFLGSHLWWHWSNKRQNKTAMLPVFWERPVLSLAALLVVSQFTRWNVEDFTIGLVFFYLLFLGIHTVYLTKYLRRQAASGTHPDKPVHN